MNAIIDFLEKHNEKELEYEKAICIESSFNKIDELAENLNYFYNFSIILNEPPFIKEDREEWYKKNALEYLKTLKGRNIFIIKKYQNKKYLELFECYLNGIEGWKKYFQCLYIAKINDKLKIISKYYIDNSKLEYRDGDKINNPGKLIEIMKINPPSEYEIDLKDYNSK